ncbi:MAG: paraquat-inducible protein A [Thermoanaerobaculia bacterium]
MTITCADCGSTQRIPLLPRHGIAECHRCDRVLDRRQSTRFDLCFVSALVVLLLLPPAAVLPLMQSSIQGILYHQSRLVSSVAEMYRQVWFPFAFGFFLTAFLLPAVRALLLVLVLGSVRWAWKIPERGRMFRWTEELRSWAMTDIVAIAGLIAYFRAAVPAEVTFLIGAWCYLAVAILAFVADRALDRRAIWNAIMPDSEADPEVHVLSCAVCEIAIEESKRRRGPCPRCGAMLNPRISWRFAPAAAAVAAALPLYLPSLEFAVIVNERLTGVWEHTILNTIQLLTDYGYWQLGVILLIAGVAVPLISLVAMVWLLARVRFPSREGLVLRTRVFRALRRIVRWPMIIPFIAAIAAPIVDFPHVDDILAGPGATPFFAVVVLLIFAVRAFQPRLMWRAAGEAQ